MQQRVRRPLTRGAWWTAVGLAVVAALANLPIREQPVPRLRASVA